jgi:hypothetical protein
LRLEGAPFAKLATLPKDGKPISKYPNQHDAFLEIVQAIRAVAGQKPAKQGGAARAAAPAARRVAEPPRSSNLRLKKEFTDHERDTFLEATYEYVAKFFEGSLAELQARNDGITGKFKATIYRNGKSVRACGIRLGRRFSRSKQIVFSDNPASTNSMNAVVGVEDDGHMLFLKAVGYTRAASGRGEKEQLTQQGLISPLQ